MTAGRMKRPWNVVGAGFNDDGVYFTFDDTTIHRGDVRLMEAAPDLLEALQAMKWSTKTGHRVRVFSSIDFPIRLVVTHHYIRAVLVRCNIQRY
ncbi:hypothetical protein, partial [Escherichia coli]|uniref:hypothetical protein n=1 Tax=Escherichia coli TaxID=562 RepID=UPI00375478CE